MRGIDSKDFRGAQLVGQKKVFEPPTAIQLRYRLAVLKINENNRTAEAWFKVFNEKIGPALMEERRPSVIVALPMGGCDVLKLLGFTVVPVPQIKGIDDGEECADVSIADWSTVN